MQVYLHTLIFNKCVQSACDGALLDIWEEAAVFFLVSLAVWVWVETSDCSDALCNAFRNLHS